jgi:hypothetical protein
VNAPIDVNATVKIDNIIADVDINILTGSPTADNEPSTLLTSLGIVGGDQLQTSDTNATGGAFFT